MNLVVAGMSYRTAPVQTREKFAVPQADLAGVGHRLREVAGLQEVVLLSTCNRVEIYGVTNGGGDPGAALFSVLGPVGAEVSQLLYFHEGAAAIRHLMRVAGSLDSMVLGETEVTGQVKNAYQTAQEAGLTGPVLNRVFQKVFHAAKMIRSKTELGLRPTSVGSVAVDVAEKVFGSSLSRSTVLIIGAGKMGEVCVRHLAKKGARSVLVVNRSFDRAESLAREISGTPIAWEDRMQALARSDIVVGAAGCSHSVIDASDVKTVLGKRGTRPLFLIDIGVPRVFAADLRDVHGAYLYDMDDLARLTAENRLAREQAIAACETIIETQLSGIIRKLHLEGAGETPISNDSHDTDVQHHSDWLLRGTIACRG